MKLIIGDDIIAHSSDGYTRWMKLQKPSLELKTSSRQIIGAKYARNFSQGWGLNFQVVVNVGREFSSYYHAENFAIAHFSKFTNGVNGRLKYESTLGKLFGFENASLSKVEIVNEIGVSSEFRYEFKCGKPIQDFDALIVINGDVLKIGDVYPTIKIKG